MTEPLAASIWLGVAVWAGAGFVVWLVLMFGGFRRFDAAAASAPLHVKLLILPGALALWPVLVLRMAGVRPVEDRGGGARP
ncbi:hypothetical protein GC169_04160 [bacterium]|nr:hypothetical protein [bacterium]